MIGSAVNDFMLSGGGEAPSADAAAAPGAATGVSPNAVGSAIKDYISSGGKSATPVAPGVNSGSIPLPSAGNVTADMAPNTGMGNAGTGQAPGAGIGAKIGGVLGTLGAGLKAAPHAGMAPIQQSNIVPNFGPMSMPAQQQMPIQQIQIPAMQNMSATSDIRSKWEIKQATKDMDKLLNTVYQNILNKRVK